jgi:hypothetical protein
MLLGQGYRTPHEAVIDEYGEMVEWWLAGENRRTQKNLLQCHFIHYEFNLKSLGI